MTKPYHHGDLAPALLRAAEEIIEQDGPQALTLRAIARRAGVSHMAPAHHFGDIAGLLSELAAIGYRDFAARIAAARGRMEGVEGARAAGRAYVAFARDKPGLFLLMFRSERLDFSRPSLAAAALSAARALRPATASASLPGWQEADAQGRAILARLVFEWSLVHGFAMLLIDGRLEGVIGEGGEAREVMALLDEVMESAGRTTA